MFYLYYSNCLDLQADLLVKLITTHPTNDTFSKTHILTQSVGMSKWLSLQIASQQGIAANIEYQLPANFFWQQYQQQLSDLATNNLYSKANMTWLLYKILPTQLDCIEFKALKDYLGNDYTSIKLYQLVAKIADLYDQYLIYRPNWLLNWQQNKINKAIDISNNTNDVLLTSIQHDLDWQVKLWLLLCDHITKLDAKQKHRATLHQEYLQLLANDQLTNLPADLYIFGISSLPAIYIEALQQLSQHIRVHIFFTNPCRYYWVNSQTKQQSLKLQQTLVSRYHQQNQSSSLTTQQQATLVELEQQADTENMLLASLGMQGKDFLYLLNQYDNDALDAYVNADTTILLGYLQQQLLDAENAEAAAKFILKPDDYSIRIHNCYSMMREVEVLHDQLLQAFSRDASLTPKDILVMLPDIDAYTPYIQAVFSKYDKYKDARYIPFSISDHIIGLHHPIISSYLELVNFKQLELTPEKILSLLEVDVIRHRFQLDLTALAMLRQWITVANIRSDLNLAINNNTNSWQAGLERLLLSGFLRTSDGVWQDCIATNIQYGLTAEFIGNFIEFIQQLKYWQTFTQNKHPVKIWQEQLSKLLANIFLADQQNKKVFIFIQQQLDTIFEQLNESNCADLVLDIDTIQLVVEQQFSSMANTHNFLRGTVNFCNLLPMRAIPFKVICLLGMNENDYPRRQAVNSFNLMQYKKQAGDRNRRDDDCYLFLEVLISAQSQLYLSYVGKSNIDKTDQQPSVLVNLLLEYLAKIMQTNIEQVRATLVQEHAMNIFSIENFQAPAVCYTNEWLVAPTQKLDTTFIQPLQQDIQLSQINLHDLLSFVQDPVKFFFNKQLNIYFTELTDSLPEMEIFKLSGLERFNLMQEFLKVDNIQDLIDDSSILEQNLKVAGKLPQANFAKVEFANIMRNCTGLLVEIKDFINTGTSQRIELDLALSSEQTIHITGTIDQLYNNTEQQRYYRTWRFGKIRDKDILQLWLYFLLLNYKSEHTYTAVYYDKDCKQLEISLDKWQALQAQSTEKDNLIAIELKKYIQAYLASMQDIQLIPSSIFSSYLKLVLDEVSADKYQQQLVELGQENYYWQRILMQDQLDIAKINQQTQAWFEQLYAILNYK